MKVLVTGAAGQLGYDVVKKLEEMNIKCIGTTKNELDITNEHQTLEFIKNYKPDVVVHCAAYTAVDKAEEDRQNCYKVNVLGTKHVAKACKQIDAKMVYISTDYIFDGEGKQPYEVTDEPNPINYYGRTKYEGEIEVKEHLDKYFIIRISWVFGVNGKNFVKTMISLGKELEELSVIADQIGSPTYTPDLANLVVEMIKTDKFGIYHATNEGYCSWYEFACEIFKQTGIQVKVKPIKTEEYPTKAMRPKMSLLSKKSLEVNGFTNLKDYKQSLNEYLTKI